VHPTPLLKLILVFFKHIIFCSSQYNIIEHDFYSIYSLSTFRISEFVGK
jgi:hypothetical protein